MSIEEDDDIPDFDPEEMYIAGQYEDEFEDGYETDEPSDNELEEIERDGM